MPILETPDSIIHYEEYGHGYPVLLFAPGFLSSRIERWRTNPARPGVPQAWLDPTAELAGRFRLIALDIRNAGSSHAPITPDDGWHSYTADHLALIAHLKVKQCHVMGACIGVSFALALAQEAPGLVTALVLQNPIGLSDDNRPVIDKEFYAWVDEQRKKGEADPDIIEAFRRNMFGNDFLFSVTRKFVSECQIPMFLMPGSDRMHAVTISADIERLAPIVEVMPDWKEPDKREIAMEKVGAFFDAHRPAA